MKNRYNASSKIIGTVYIYLIRAKGSSKHEPENVNAQINEKTAERAEPAEPARAAATRSGDDTNCYSWSRIINWNKDGFRKGLSRYLRDQTN